ncbi:transcription factor IIIA-like, partial [Psammomys obesus]|uniref:transcription factor IIIA-like n=1 Tax=Psammomys obesus TaxID=48139 RepID=UPI00245371F4
TPSCPACGRSFRRAEQLRRHAPLHAHERRVWRCGRPGCARAYTSAGNLRVHVLGCHEGLRPFACARPGCGRAFASKQSLERHGATHEPGRSARVRTPRGTRSLASRLSGFDPRGAGACERACQGPPVSAQ